MSVVESVHDYVSAAPKCFDRDMVAGPLLVKSGGGLLETQARTRRFGFRLSRQCRRDIGGFLRTRYRLNRFDLTILL